MLLRFKPLYGTYIGANLSNVLLKTLIEHNLKARVFGLTTDNISNNKTMFDSLQQGLSDSVIIVRILCLAHVI